jgi:hypothetical protein
MMPRCPAVETFLASKATVSASTESMPCFRARRGRVGVRSVACRFGMNALTKQLQTWFEARRPRVGAWDDLELRELKSLPTLSPALGSRRRRYDLVLRLGPMSNEYPTDGARANAERLPDVIASLIAEELLDCTARGHVAQARMEESADDDGHLTFEVVIPLSIELVTPVGG